MGNDRVVGLLVFVAAQPLLHWERFVFNFLRAAIALGLRSALAFVLLIRYVCTRVGQCPFPCCVLQLQ